MWALLLGPAGAAAAAAAQGGADAAGPWPSVVSYAITGMIAITGMFLLFLSGVMYYYVGSASPPRAADVQRARRCPCPTEGCTCQHDAPNVRSIRGAHARFRQSHPVLKEKHGCEHGPETCCALCALMRHRQLGARRPRERSWPSCSAARARTEHGQPPTCPWT